MSLFGRSPPFEAIEPSDAPAACSTTEADVIRFAVDRALAVTAAELVSVVLLAEDGRPRVFARSREPAGAEAGRESRDVLGHVLRTGEALAGSTGDQLGEVLRPLNLASCACVAIQRGPKIVGALWCAHGSRADALGKPTLPRLKEISEEIEARLSGPPAFGPVSDAASWLKRFRPSAMAAGLRHRKLAWHVFLWRRH